MQPVWPLNMQQSATVAGAVSNEATRFRCFVLQTTKHFCLLLHWPHNLITFFFDMGRKQHQKPSPGDCGYLICEYAAFPSDVPQLKHRQNSTHYTVDTLAESGTFFFNQEHFTSSSLSNSQSTVGSTDLDIGVKGSRSNKVSIGGGSLCLWCKTCVQSVSWQLQENQKKDGWGASHILLGWATHSLGWRCCTAVMNQQWRWGRQGLSEINTALYQCFHLLPATLWEPSKIFGHFNCKASSLHGEGNLYITQVWSNDSLFACSRSHIFSAPDREPATTISSELLNLTDSTEVVWPDRLCNDQDTSTI